jgi:hypothetical protein
MNVAYTTLKGRGDSEEMIYDLPSRDFNRYISHGMLRVAQGRAIEENPAERAGKNAAL